jgi:hypothetical protein
MQSSAARANGSASLQMFFPDHPLFHRTFIRSRARTQNGQIKGTMPTDTTKNQIISGKPSFQ